jgi:hypothetical protein
VRFADALEERQRAALNRLRPQLVVKVGRSGLNDHHPAVRMLYAAIDRVLKPIVAAEERRASAHLMKPGVLRARDQVGVRALNDALKGAFETPGPAAFEPGGGSTELRPLATASSALENSSGAPSTGEPRVVVEASPRGLSAPPRWAASPRRPS